MLLLALSILWRPAFNCNNITFSSCSSNDSLKVIEKVYLHIDRDCYLPGDIIWFKAYLIDASFGLLSSQSNNLHVELISPTARIIDSQIIRLNEGLGNGDFKIPFNLKPGRYLLRAYTNYMRNFNDQIFFKKDISIIDSSGKIWGNPDSAGNIKNRLDINFFPEGGSLVENVNSIVAFKAVNALGAGCQISGDIYSSSGDKIISFKSNRLGMGTFPLKPVPGQNYFAVINSISREEIRSEIPRSFSTGIVLNISKNDSQKPEVSIRTNIETLPLVINHDLKLTVSARNTPLKSYIFKIKSIYTSFIFPTDDLPDGIVMFNLSSLDSLPLCERLVYIQNNEDIRLNVETDKLEYKQRDSVKVRLSLSENSGTETDAFLSFSAFNNLYANNLTQFPSTISSWFLLESDIRGPIEDPSYYFDPSNSNRLEDIDLLLLTQGWRDFKWKYEKEIFTPENGFTISGRLRKVFANVPLAGSKINIALFGEGNSIICTVTTDSSGRFYLKGVDLTGIGRLIVTAKGKKEHRQGWLLLDSLKYSPAEISENLFNQNLHLNDNHDSNTNTETLIQDAEIKNAIKKKYKLSDTISLNEVKIISRRTENLLPPQVVSARRIYGTPDKEVIVTPLLQTQSNLVSLLAGTVAGVWVMRIPQPWDKDSQIRIQGSRGQPLFVLDGNVVKYEDINTIPLSFIDRIDVLKPGATSSIYGMRGANGVISVITRSGELYAATPPPPVHYSVNTKFIGYNEPRIFYSPKHSSTLEPDYKPDLRTTIFWEPNLKIENNKKLFLNYFNADNPSTIMVIVEGITSTGIPVTARTVYYVK
jgi:TonB-dependent SusC/RagA subfamily outer membrane receptor